MLKYPEIFVDLVGEDGNAFSILGRVNKALKNAHVPADIIAEFNADAQSGDYDHLLQTVMKYVNINKELYSDLNC